MDQAFRHARRANVPVQEMICIKIDKIISDLTHQPLSGGKHYLQRFHGKPNDPNIRINTTQRSALA